MYADDTNIFFSEATPECLEERANAYLVKLSKWPSSNKLHLNTSKTKYVIFKPVTKPLTNSLKIMFEGELIEQVTEQKFLDVWFNQELKWNTHVSKLKSELPRVLG